MNANLCPDSRPRYEFCFPRLDTLVQVEERSDMVIIRATRDTFSERHKALFVRELAAEGFISDTYEWLTGCGSWSSLHVCWLVDCSWLKPGTAATSQTNRIMLRLLGSAIALWLVMMAVLLATSR